jgi:hypothetical protein
LRRAELRVRVGCGDELGGFEPQLLRIAKIVVLLRLRYTFGIRAVDSCQQHNVFTESRLIVRTNPGPDLFAFAHSHHNGPQRRIETIATRHEVVLRARRRCEEPNWRDREPVQVATSCRWAFAGSKGKNVRGG